MWISMMDYERNEFEMLVNMVPGVLPANLRSFHFLKFEHVQAVSCAKEEKNTEDVDMQDSPANL